MAKRIAKYDHVLDAAALVLFGDDPVQNMFVFNSRKILPSAYTRPVTSGDLTMFVEMEMRRMKPVNRLLKSGNSQ